MNIQDSDFYIIPDFTDFTGYLNSCLHENIDFEMMIKMKIDYRYYKNENWLPVL